MFHNNWIVSTEAKEYRLKELGLFYSPHDDYSDETVNYLTYEPLGLEATIEEEQSLLETALRLSIALDRVLILPSFSCHANDTLNQQSHHVLLSDGCTLNTYWCVRQFDSVFKGRYREHISYDTVTCFPSRNSFLFNPRVPQSVRDAFDRATTFSFRIGNGESLEENASFISSFIHSIIPLQVRH